MKTAFLASPTLNAVSYEIRGALYARAETLAAEGHSILRLNIGNPGRYGLHAAPLLVDEVARGLVEGSAYSHHKGLLEARQTIAERERMRGANADADRVFLGNGVSELIDLLLRALLERGDEVLIPSPDYPLWTAATVLNGGIPVHYPCPESLAFAPDLAAIEARIGPRTKALVVINPNNPTGAVYDLATLRALAELAERHQLVLLTDEIYDQVLYDDAQFFALAPLVRETLCITLSGLSKVQRACGWRVGWASISGAVDRARGVLDGIEKLASLRLCSNVPGQYAVRAALTLDSSINALTAPGGRLAATRAALLDGIAASSNLCAVRPDGALYAFPGVVGPAAAHFDDEIFALELLERKHVLLVPGSGFNVPYRDHMRLTLLPPPAVMREVIGRIDELLTEKLRAPHTQATLVAS